MTTGTGEVKDKVEEPNEGKYRKGSSEIVNTDTKECLSE
jgi:hypothetical protein